MALRVYNAAPRSSMVQGSASHGNISKQVMSVPQLMKRKERSFSINLRVKASLDATAAAAAEPEVEFNQETVEELGQEIVEAAVEVAVKLGQVTEVCKDTFWPIVKAAGDRTVVLDMYTQWCGPCKIMAPKFQQLSEKYDDVVFLKLDCNKDNRELAKELGLKVVPTFKILKDSKIVKVVTGAKFDDLALAIETARSS